MALLDSLLAFALTLAALATVVTLILEIFVRFLRLKTINQIALITKLVDEPDSQEPDSQDSEKTDAKNTTSAEVVRHVLTNPFVKSRFGWLDSLFATVKPLFKWLGKPFANWNVRFGKPGSLFATWQKAGNYYQDVSLEHTLRRLLESLERRNRRDDEATKTHLQSKSEVWARKYDEYRSALAAQFKTRAQFWSLIVGVVLALAMNINGLRVFEVYLQDPDLRQKAIEELQKDQAELDAAAKSVGDTAASKEYKELENRYQDLRSKLDKIEGLDLPIGWAYFPGCSAPESKGPSDPRCPLSGGHQFDVVSLVFWGWLAQVLITGILIGLGAPFWYDVARRLAAVRGAFGGAKTAEVRHRGEDAAGDPDARRKLIERVVADFVGRVRSTPAIPSNGNGSTSTSQET